eukprot:1092125_1
MSVFSRTAFRQDEEDFDDSSDEDIDCHFGTCVYGSSTEPILTHNTQSTHNQSKSNTSTSPLLLPPPPSMATALQLLSTCKEQQMHVQLLSTSLSPNPSSISIQPIFNNQDGNALLNVNPLSHNLDAVSSNNPAHPPLPALPAELKQPIYLNAMELIFRLLSYYNIDVEYKIIWEHVLSACSMPNRTGKNKQAKITSQTVTSILHHEKCFLIFCLFVDRMN